MTMNKIWFNYNYFISWLWNMGRWKNQFKFNHEVSAQFKLPVNMNKERKIKSENCVIFGLKCCFSHRIFIKNLWGWKKNRIQWYLKIYQYILIAIKPVNYSKLYHPSIIVILPFLTDHHSASPLKTVENVL